jgi:hypothetical protein
MTIGVPEGRRKRPSSAEALNVKKNRQFLA